jgi:hypothetical protein
VVSAIAKAVRKVELVKDNSAGVMVIVVRVQLRIGVEQRVQNELRFSMVHFVV